MAHPFKIDRILLATDLSPAGEPAVLYATALAGRFDAELYVLHVVPTPAGPCRASEAWEQEATAAMRQLRQHLLALHDKYAQTAVLSGEPAARILQKADDVHADLIVMGTSAHGPRPGGLTDTVLRGAPCPVVAVPLAQEERAELHP